MKNSKYLIIALIVLVATFTIVQLTKRKGRSKNFRTELVAYDAESIDKIEISGKESFSLIKEDSVWIVKDSLGITKKVKDNSASSLLSTILTVKPDRLASRSGESWADYLVDEKSGTRVKIFSGGSVVSDIIIGKFGVEGQNSFFTYVRLAEDEEVYISEGFMSMSVPRASKDFRNDIVLSLEKDSLTTITFESPKENFTLIKNQGTWYVNGDQAADSTTVVDYLSGLGYVTSKEFYNGSLPAITRKVIFSFSHQPDLVIEGSETDQGFIIRSGANQIELFSDTTLVNKMFKSSASFIPTS